ncbi:MAG: polyhydroxyalkanoate synthesis repressor PhaR [Pseudomonadota bacterium]
MSSPGGDSGKQGDPITIKKYANRRLYNTATSSYVTLDHLCQMVQEDIDFVVYDAKSGEDITRAVLTQIIVEEEAKGQNLLPVNFLRQLISFYGDSMQWMVPGYLDQMMGAFAQNQDRMRQSIQDTFGNMFPFTNMDDLSKQNMAVFDNAMRWFAPFQQSGASTGSESHGNKSTSGPTQPANPASASEETETLEQLKAQVDLLQRQLDALQKEKPKR